MRIIIGGCGRVGTMLATRLSLDGHQVAVVDQDPAAFERLGSGFGGTSHRGKVFDRVALESAGIESADGYCAVTSGDNSNVVSAKIAKEVYGVPRVVARIYEPRRAEIYRRLGISAVSSVSWVTNEVLSVLIHPELSGDLTFGDGEVRVVSSEVPPRLDGRAVDHLSAPGEIAPVAIVRSGRSHIPAAGEPLATGDILHAAVATQAIDRFAKMLAP